MEETKILTGPSVEGTDLVWKSAEELGRLYRSRSISPVEVVQAHLDRIEDLDPQLHSFVTVTPERALETAKAAESAFRNGETLNPLLGVPFALKDLVPTKGIRTTKGSLRFQDWVPDEDSPLARRALGTGAALLGKTTTSEMGWKAASANRVSGAARNPHRLEATAGGSSGGAAAAVAAGLVTIAQGGDGAGSIRIPAAFCGVVGMKPTPGTIPYYPPTPLGTLVANGPLARTVRDAALLMDALSGPDIHDPLSLGRRKGGFFDSCSKAPAKIRIAYAPQLGGRSAEPAIAAAVDQAVLRIRDAGHSVTVLEETPADRFDLLNIIWTTGFATLFPEGGEDLDPGLDHVIRTGKSFSGSDLAAAHLQRQEYRAEYSQLLENYDVLITPTTSVLSFGAEADHPDTVNSQKANYLDWAWYTYTFNLTEHPAISLPIGHKVAGLPIGLQIVGKHHRDRELMSIASAIEAILTGQD